MGWLYVIGGCFVCGGTFAFHPDLVPSHPDDEGIRQPICESCVTLINRKRAELGVTQWPVHPDAYEPQET